MNPSIIIKPAAPEDRGTLIDMFLKLLQFLDHFHHDMLPTKKNATLMVDTLFLPAANNGEPVLIAWDEETLKPAGAIFWPHQHMPYETRWRSAFGYGTYIEETYRSSKVGTLLRHEAVRILKEQGIEKLVGLVIFENQISLKASDRFGFKPHARLDLLDIPSYPLPS